MTLILTLALLHGPARAEEPADAHAPPPIEAPPPVVAPPPVDAPPAAPPRDFGLTLDVAETLRREGERDAAHALADWVAVQPDAGLDADRARELGLRAAPRSGETWPKVRLIGLQAGFGATVFGAGPALLELFPERPGLYFGTALLGGAAGTTGAILLARREDFQVGQVHALIASQELVTFNLMALAAQAEDERTTGAALIGGAAIGTGLGLAWALNDPDPARALGLQSGAFWGTGLAAVGLGYTYSFDRLDERVPLALAGGADLGAGLGYALTALLPVTPHHVQMINAGGVIGAGAALGFTSMTANLIWYTPHSVAAAIGGAGLAGGALGAVLATRFEQAEGLPMTGSLLHKDGRHLRLSVPTPRAFAVPGEPDAVAWGFDLVNQPL